MTRERQDITEDFYVGNHKVIRDTVYDRDGALFDLTSAEATFFLLDEDDGTVYLTKSSSEPTEIEVDDVNSLVIVYLIPSDTLRLNAPDLYGTFRYQIHVYDQNGNEETITTGRINIFQSPLSGRARKDTVSAYLPA